MRRSTLIGFLLVIVATPHLQGQGRGGTITVTALIEAGRLDDAERAARGGGTPLTVPLANVLVKRGKLAAAESLYTTAIRDRLPGYRSAEASLAELFVRHGQYADAQRTAKALTDAFEGSAARWSPDDQVAAARGYVVLGHEAPQQFHTALAVFDAAAAADSTNLDARILAADLLLDKFNAPDARLSYHDALAIAPNQPRALLGLAMVSAFAGDSDVAPSLKKALAGNANLVGAHLLLARAHLEAEAYDSAAIEANRALAVDSASIDGWSILGGMAWLSGDSAGYRRARTAAEAINPRPAEFYMAIAGAAARQRRYADAVSLARQALALDSTSADAYTTLGTNELRSGEMVLGRQHIERAFKLDPYNLWNKNTLDLLDQLKNYKTVNTARFQLVVPPEEADYLTLTLGPLLEKAYDTFAARYQYRPPTPIRIEVFRRHADFSVRGIGLAGLGALGVSFGTVLAMDGPLARPPGEFNFASTAWHELAHTFTLGLSNHRVPRWLSEGLSVLEERRAGRGWGANVNREFLAAYKGGFLLPVSRINDGFVRPAFPQQLMFSYYEASLICEMIEADKGIDGIRTMLRGFGSGREMTAVLREVYGIDQAAFDARYDAWFRKRFATALTNITAADGKSAVKGAYADQVSEARMQLRAGDLTEARRVLEAAQAMFPEDGSVNSAAWYLSQVAYQQGDLPTAAKQLARVTMSDETADAANAKLAEILEAQGDLSGALAALDRLSWMTPYDGKLHARMADVAERANDLPRAVLERRAVVGLQPPDKLEARFQLAQVLAKAGDKVAAKREILLVLEEAPSFEKAQQLLLELQKGATP